MQGTFLNKTGHIKETDMPFIAVKTVVRVLLVMACFLVAGCAATPLRSAAQRGDVERVKQLLAEGADVNYSDEHGFTAMHIAAEKNQVEIIRLLLNAGADPNAQTTDTYKNLPIHRACFRGSTDAVMFLLDRGHFMEARNAAGFTPLLTAARYRNEPLAIKLVERGADIHACQANQWTSLHLASKYFQPKLGKLLIERGADINARTDAGLTASDILKTELLNSRARRSSEHVGLPPQQQFFIYRNMQQYQRTLTAASGN
jgi:ankyrin repeat protein